MQQLLLSIMSVRPANRCNNIPTNHGANNQFWWKRDVKTVVITPLTGSSRLRAVGYCNLGFGKVTRGPAARNEPLARGTTRDVLACSNFSALELLREQFCINLVFVYVCNNILNTTNYFGDECCHPFLSCRKQIWNVKQTTW